MIYLMMKVYPVAESITDPLQWNKPSYSSILVNNGCIYLFTMFKFVYNGNDDLVWTPEDVTPSGWINFPNKYEIMLSRSKKLYQTSYLFIIVPAVEYSLSITMNWKNTKVLYPGWRKNYHTNKLIKKSSSASKRQIPIIYSVSASFHCFRSDHLA